MFNRSKNRSVLGCRVAVLVSVIAASTAVAQSGNQKDKPALKKEGEKLFAPGKSKPAAADAPDAATWSIVIDAFRGDDKDVEARKCLEKVRTQGGLSDAYMEERGKSTVVACGRFAASDSKEAKAALTRIHNTEVIIAGIKTKPFVNAFLAPPADIPGTLPEYDLRGTKKANGSWVLYSLQVAVYTRVDKQPTPGELKEFRKAAEQAVTQLRREGEQAYYYHGPTASMVTIGLFGAEDYDPQSPQNQSPQLVALRQRYPHNLFNGQGLRDKVTVTSQSGKQVKAERIQPSALIAVPKSE